MSSAEYGAQDDRSWASMGGDALVPVKARCPIVEECQGEV